MSYKNVKLNVIEIKRESPEVVSDPRTLAMNRPGKVRNHELLSQHDFVWSYNITKDIVI